MTEDDDARYRATIADLSRRLERVRGEMTDAEYSKLVIDMARTAELFAEIDAAHTRRLPWDSRGPETTE